MLIEIHFFCCCCGGYWCYCMTCITWMETPCWRLAKLVGADRNLQITIFYNSNLGGDITAEILSCQPGAKIWVCSGPRLTKPGQLKTEQTAWSGESQVLRNLASTAWIRGSKLPCVNSVGSGADGGGLVVYGNVFLAHFGPFNTSQSSLSIWVLLTRRVPAWPQFTIFWWLLTPR